MNGSAHHGKKQDTPGDNGVESKASFEAVSSFQLAFFKGTTTFEYFMEEFYGEAYGVILYKEECIMKRGDFDSGKQHP